MSHDELSYYRERAAIERQRAAGSTNAHAVEIHRKLAELYEQLVELEQVPPPKRSFSIGSTQVQA